MNYLISNLIYICFRKKKFEIKFSSLIIQLIIGRRISGVLWYHFNLIFLTIFFYIISFSFKNNYLFFLQIIGIVSYLLQLSELNYNFFNKYSSAIKYSVGYINETLPLSITGLCLSSFNVINKLKEERFKFIFFSSFFIFIFFKYDIFKEVKGFGKQGFMYNIGGSLLFISFYLIPLDNLSKTKTAIVNRITNYTAGIYFLHITIYKIIKNHIFSVKSKSMLGCIYIFYMLFNMLSWF